MDKPRTDQHIRRRRRMMIIGAVVLMFGVLAVGIARLKPAPATVERSLVWIDTVKRGPMLRQVRGIGTLVPEDIAWITSRTSGRVEKIVLRPGAIVKPDDVILVLASPEAQQAALDAASQLSVAEAELTNQKGQIRSNVLSAKAAAAAAQSDYEQAKLRAEVNERLFKKGLVPELEMRSSKVAAEQAQVRTEVEQERYAFARDSAPSQLAVKWADLKRAQAQARLKREEAQALNVRAGMNGVLQVVPVEIGAQVGAGTNLARVADPARLQAQIKVAETQAKDVQLGQPASIDTRNGVVEGRVSRIDPAVKDGTVTVDVTLTQALPPGARPDLSVDGTIELERLANVVYVGRPAFGEEKSTVNMFRLDAKASEAVRTKVRLGRSSVNTVEILGGLAPGDKVILSDMSQWDEHDRIRLN